MRFSISAGLTCPVLPHATMPEVGLPLVMQSRKKSSVLRFGSAQVFGSFQFGVEFPVQVL